MIPRLTSTFSIALLLAAAPLHSADDALQKRVQAAVLAEMNLDDDETDSLPYEPHFVVVPSAKQDAPALVAVAFGNTLELFRNDRTKLTPIAGSAARLGGRSIDLKLVELNGDAVPELRVEQLSSSATTSDSYFTLRGTTLQPIANFANSFALDLDHDGRSEVFVPVDDDGDDQDDEMPLYAIYRWSGSSLRESRLVAANEIVTDTADEETFQLAIGERGCNAARLHVVRDPDSSSSGGEVILSFGDDELTRMDGDTMAVDAELKDVHRPIPLRVVTRGANESRILLIVEEECVASEAPVIMTADGR